MLCILAEWECEGSQRPTLLFTKRVMSWSWGPHYRTGHNTHTNGDERGGSGTLSATGYGYNTPLTVYCMD